MTYARKFIFGVLCIFALGFSGCAKDPTDARVKELLGKTKSASQSFPCTSNTVSVNMFIQQDGNGTIQYIILVAEKQYKTFMITWLDPTKNPLHEENFVFTENKWKKVRVEEMANLVKKSLTEEEKKIFSICYDAHMLELEMSF